MEYHCRCEDSIVMTPLRTDATHTDKMGDGHIRYHHRGIEYSKSTRLETALPVRTVGATRFVTSVSQNQEVPPPEPLVLGSSQNSVSSDDALSESVRAG